MSDNHESFVYSYSAKEQAEVKRIREKYAPQETDKLAQLRALDAGATRKGTVVSLILGVLGALIMGFGMSMVMSDLGQLMHIGDPTIPGILIGIAGMVPVILAYPAYKAITHREREKIAPEVLRLTEELLK